MSEKFSEYPQYDYDTTTDCEDCEARIKADYLNEIIDILNDSFPMTPSADITCGYYCAIERLEQLKEQKCGIH